MGVIEGCEPPTTNFLQMGEGRCAVILRRGHLNPLKSPRGIKLTCVLATDLRPHLFFFFFRPLDCENIFPREVQIAYLAILVVKVTH